MANDGERERQKLVGRAGIVGAGTLFSRVLGLGRDMALAAIFRREETDAFFVAFTIPNALRQLLGEGAISSAVVPVLSKKLAEDDGDVSARAFFSRVRGASLVALVVVTLLGMIFARPISEVFAGGYHGAELERTVQLTRIVFPYLFFMGTAALGMAALNAKRKFAVAAFAPGLLNVAFIAAAFLLPGPFERMGIDRSIAIGVGALVGGALQVLAQWPALRKIGFASRPKIDFKDPAVREVLRRIAPMTFGIGVYYVDLVLSRRFLSELGTGAQSYFTWAMRLCDFPQGIFVMALSTVALPSLSEFAARGDMDELGKTFAHGLKLALFVAIPASVAFAFLAEPLVVTLFQRGQFDSISAHETAKALFYQGGAIWTVAVVRQVVPVFYALGDTRTPVLVSALDLLAFIFLATTLRGHMGHVGISIAVGGSSFVQMALLVVMLRRKLDTMHGQGILSSVLKTLAASVVGVLAARASIMVMTDFSVPRAIPGLLAFACFCAVFVIAALLLKSSELGELTGALQRRLARK
ncbi:MAG: murein biosynthesis integral membrane protein MurJ [Polyangiaceae bacterium]